MMRRGEDAWERDASLETLGRPLKRARLGSYASPGDQLASSSEHPSVYESQHFVGPRDDSGNISAQWSNPFHDGSTWAGFNSITSDSHPQHSPYLTNSTQARINTNFSISRTSDAAEIGSTAKNLPALPDSCHNVSSNRDADHAVDEVCFGMVRSLSPVATACCAFYRAALIMTV
jgi:hypothetical protein